MDNLIDQLIEAGERKKSRVVLRLSPGMDMFSDEALAAQEGSSLMMGYCISCVQAVANVVPAVMFDFSAFAFYGINGLLTLMTASKVAHGMGLYVIVDGCFGGPDVVKMCESCFYADGSANDVRFYADAVTLSPYCSADDLKKIAALCREEDKAAFIVAKNTLSGDEEHIENIKTAAGDRLYETAVDDAGAFGEAFVGEKGYSVLGFVTPAGSDLIAMRGIDRWGIGLVKAGESDLDRDLTYGLFYPGEREGCFIVLEDRDLSEKKGDPADGFGLGGKAEKLAKLVKKVEEKRLSR